MNLHQHFDPDIATALETALELHPELARFIHHRVTQHRDLTDNFGEIHKRAIGNTREDTIRTAEEHRRNTRQPTPTQTKPLPTPQVLIIPKRTHAPQTERPKRTRKPKPKIERDTPLRRLKTAEELDTLQRLTPYRTKHKTRTIHPPIRIDTVTYKGDAYITTHLTRQLVINTPLENINMYREGTAFLTTSSRYPVVRRLEIGPQQLEPTILVNQSDCRAMIEARLNGFDVSTLTRHDPAVAHLMRIHHDGYEWMKLSEAMAIVTDLPMPFIANIWTHRSNREKLRTTVYQWIYDRARRGKMPILNVGERKGALLRTIDIMPLAGAKRGIIE